MVYDITFRFCQKFLSPGDRTIDQMIQAARSGKKNILEQGNDLNHSQNPGASYSTRVSSREGLGWGGVREGVSASGG